MKPTVAGWSRSFSTMANGTCLFAKRLDQGAFTWPTTQPSADGTASVTLTTAQMAMLLEGLDWRTPVQTRRLMVAG